MTTIELFRNGQQNCHRNKQMFRIIKLYRESKPSINIFKHLPIQARFGLLYFIFAVGQQIGFHEERRNKMNTRIDLYLRRCDAIQCSDGMKRDGKWAHVILFYDSHVVNVRFMWFHGMDFALVCFMRCFVVQTTNIRHCFCIGVRSSMFGNSVWAFCRLTSNKDVPAVN